jgi:hypothetical protein
MGSWGDFVAPVSGGKNRVPGGNPMYPFTDDEAEAIKAMREAFDSEGLGLAGHRAVQSYSVFERSGYRFA